MNKVIDDILNALINLRAAEDFKCSAALKSCFNQIKLLSNNSSIMSNHKEYKLYYDKVLTILQSSMDVFTILTDFIKDQSQTEKLNRCIFKITRLMSNIDQTIKNWIKESRHSKDSHNKFQDNISIFKEFQFSLKRLQNELDSIMKSTLIKSNDSEEHSINHNNFKKLNTPEMISSQTFVPLRNSYSEQNTAYTKFGSDDTPTNRIYGNSYSKYEPHEKIKQYDIGSSLNRSLYNLSNKIIWNKGNLKFNYFYTLLMKCKHSQINYIP